MLHETQISRTFYFTPCLWPRTFRMCGHEFAQQSQFAGSPAIGQNVREIGGLLSGPAHSCVGSNTNLPDISYYSLPLTESNRNVWPSICPAKSGPPLSGNMSLCPGDWWSQNRNHHMQQTPKTWAQAYCTCPKSPNPSSVLHTQKHIFDDHFMVTFIYIFSAHLKSTSFL